MYFVIDDALSFSEDQDRIPARCLGLMGSRKSPRVHPPERVIDFSIFVRGLDWMMSQRAGAGRRHQSITRRNNERGAR